MAEFPEFSELPIEVQTKLFMSNPARQTDGITAEQFQEKLLQQRQDKVQEERLKVVELRTSILGLIGQFCEATDPKHPPVGMALGPGAIKIIHELLHELGRHWQADPKHWINHTAEEYLEHGDDRD